MELPIALSKLQNNYIKRLQEFLRILITSTITPIRQNAMKILCLIFFFSLLPYNMEIATPLPIQSPKSIDVKNVISV